MFKRLIKAYVENRLNAIDKEIEVLAKDHAEAIGEAEQMTVLKQSTFKIDNSLRKRILILQSKALIYKPIFGDMYSEEN